MPIIAFQMGITIKDIASLAGVSRGTVDRALNNRGQIAPDVRDKILRIAKQHGYEKNVLASSLARNKKIELAIVLPDPTLDAFWQTPVDGINSTKNFIEPYGLHLNFHFFDHADVLSYCTALDQAINEKPNAILIAPIFLKESLLYFQIAEQNNIPFVCINSEINHEDILCYIGQNSYECGLLAGKLFNLTNRKKKKVLTITLGHHSKNAIHIDKKIEGLQTFNKDNGAPFEIIDLVYQDFNNQLVKDQLSEEICTHQEELHGIFFTNSRAYKLLNHNRILEEQLSETVVIGFDLIEENIQLLERGVIDFLLNQNPRRQGYLGIINLFNHFIYQKEIPKKRYLPVDVVVKENYKQYLEIDESDLTLVS